MIELSLVGCWTMLEQSLVEWRATNKQFLVERWAMIEKSLV